MEKWPYVGDILWGPVTTLWSPQLYALGVPPYAGCVGPSAVAGLNTVGMLQGGAGPQHAWRLLAHWRAGWVLAQMAAFPEGAWG